MRILRPLFDFYLQSSLHVGLAVLALLHGSFLQLHATCSQPLSLAVFWGTVLGYNCLKYAQLFWSGKGKSARYQAIAVCTALAALGFMYQLWQLPRQVQQLLLGSGILVLVYPLLRRFGWLKLFFVSAAVTYITVFIPVSILHKLDVSFVFLLLQRFFLLSSLLIPFEIWDSQFDETHLHTLPQRLGIRNTKLLGYGLLLPVLVLLAWQADYQMVTVVVVALAALSIYFTSLQRSIYYTSFWVESVPIVWWVVLLVMK